MYAIFFFFNNFLYRYDTISTLQSYLDNQAMYFTDLGHQGILWIISHMCRRCQEEVAN